MKETPRAVIYTRVSTGIQAEEITCRKKAADLSEKER